MKKAIVVLLSCLMVLAGFSLLASAEVKQLEIPKVAAPVVDGIISDGEWDGALTVEMSKNDASLFLVTGGMGAFESATFRFVWNDDGIYFAADVADTTAPMTPPAADAGSYNSGDGIQFNIYTSAETAGQEPGTLLFFSFNPKTDSGKACVGEHFTYSDGTTGANVDSAQISAVFNGNAYTIEGLIPAEAFAKITPALTLAEGAQIFMNNVVMEMDEAGNQALIVDNEWFDASKANVYTLAGAPETAAEPVTEAPEDTETAAQADDTAEDIAPADETAEDIAPAPVAPVDTAKAEDDGATNCTWLYIAIAAGVVVIAAVVVIIIKKKGKKAE